MKKEQEKIPENEEQKESGKVSRRDFLVGTGAVVVGGAIGAGLLSGCKEGETVTTTVTQTSTKTVPTTITAAATTVTQTVTTQVGAGATVTATETVTQPGGGAVEPWQEPEETTLHTVSLGGNGGDPLSVDVKHGKIVRIRPFHYEDIYTKEELSGSIWKYEARGKTFNILMKASPPYFAIPYKKRIYSPVRVKYPLKRVDWEPGGDPAKINPQNRGLSKFKRISWDEAGDIIASEIKRVQDKYGMYSVFCLGSNGHMESKTVHKGGGCHMLLMDYAGGYTKEIRNADSWEGWYWGAMHVWGTGSNGLAQLPFGEVRNIELVLKNTEMIVWEGGDWETTPGGFGAQSPSRLLYFFNEVGIKQIFISPDLNYAGAVHAYKWIPVLPNTDAALQLAIAYTWIVEDTYDKEYIATHTVGFDDHVKPYIMGDEDGVPKTPAWASKRCGVSEWLIKALAREWANRRTSTAHYFGSVAERGPYSHEPARCEANLLAMQGIGKPGVYQLFNRTMYGPFALGSLGTGAKTSLPYGKTAQLIPRTQTWIAILEGKCDTWGTTQLGNPVEDQFTHFVYPIPEADGGCKVHLLWSEKVCNTVCWNEGFKFIEAMRHPDVECFIANHQWMENDCLYADLVLPVTTNFENNDLMSNNTYGGEWRTLYLMDRSIPPIGESKSDWEISCFIAQKLEKYGGTYADLYNKFVSGKNEDEWIQGAWDAGRHTEMSFETWKEKKMFIPPVDEERRAKPNGWELFYEDPENNPIPLPTGKLELYSQRLADTWPDDKERSPIGRWVPGGPGWTHDETLDVENGAVRCKTYPLLLVSNHPRWRHHPQCDDVPWLREIPTCKVKGYDAYLYEPLWINPIDAAKKGIRQGDIVKMWNERGIVLGGAYITERIIPGAVYQDHGAHLDIIKDGVDRGGSNNLISPRNGSSKNCWGMACSGFLVDVAKLENGEMDQWYSEHPENFEKDYDPAYGHKLSTYVEEEM